MENICRNQHTISFLTRVLRSVCNCSTLRYVSLGSGLATQVLGLGFVDQVLVNIIIIIYYYLFAIKHT